MKDEWRQKKSDDGNIKRCRRRIQEMKSSKRTHHGKFYKTAEDKCKKIYNKILSSTEILNHYKRGALRLNVSVRSCDDTLCNGESWQGPYENSTTQLSTPKNRYFQFKFNFFTKNETYSPKLHNVSIKYSR